MEQAFCLSISMCFSVSTGNVLVILEYHITYMRMATDNVNSVKNIPLEGNEYLMTI